MRPLVLTLATDGYDAVWRFCLDSQSRYCARMGYEHRIVTACIAGLNGKWSKLQLALEALREGRDVLVIDADAAVTDEAPGFVEALRALDGDIAVALGISGRPNSGVMMLSGAEGSVAAGFLADCLAERETPVPREDFVTTEGENGHVINILKRAPYADRLRHLDRRWNCTMPDEAPAAFVRHYTNELRKHLHSGAGLAGLLAGWRPADEREKNKRESFRKHFAQRRNILLRLRDEPQMLEPIKARVENEKRLEYPRMVVDNPNAWLWRFEFAKSLLELPTIEFLRRLVRPDMWIVDGGAHVGYFADAFLAAGATPGQVLAIEAHPDNAMTLRANIDARGARVIETALGDKDGVVSFNDGAGHSNSSLMSGGPASGRTFDVEMTSLDKIADAVGMDRLGVMKLDVEGAEPMALRGAAGLLERSPDAVLVVESNPQMLQLAGSSPDGLIRQLGAMDMVGRMILDNFALGPPGFAFPARTVNIAFARPDRWRTIIDRDLGHAGGQ